MKKLIVLIALVFSFVKAQEIEYFNDNFVSQQTNVKLAVVIDKKKFFRFIPSIMNSLNAYFIHKGDKFHIKLFSITDDLNTITNSYKDIIYITTNKDDIYKLQNYDATFYIPTFHKDDFNQTFENVYFGLIDFNGQIKKLAQYLDSDTANVVHTKGMIAQKLLNYEYALNINLNVFNFPRIPYYKMRNRYVFFNTSASQTAQVLAQLTSRNIHTKLQFAPQVDYDPLLITITQPQDTQKIIIANSILNLPVGLEDTNMLLSSDIRFNWLNYDISILANKIYNKQTDQDEWYMNDFKIYMFEHQTQYETKLYRIFKGAFIEVK